MVAVDFSSVDAGCLNPSISQLLIVVLSQNLESEARFCQEVDSFRRLWRWPPSPASSVLQIRTKVGCLCRDGWRTQPPAGSHWEAIQDFVIAYIASAGLIAILLYGWVVLWIWRMIKRSSGWNWVRKSW